MIRNTFNPYLQPGQQFPQALVSELLQQYSTKAGYTLYSDVQPFFQMLREARESKDQHSKWKWDKTVVGIITNSDDRVPGILESFGLSIGPRRVGTSDERRREATLQDDISFVVLSYDVGVEKPDGKIFNAAIGMLEETLSGHEDGLFASDFEKVYVGDDLRKDYDGAMEAGWQSVLLLRHSSGEVDTSGTYGHMAITDKDGKARTITGVRSLLALAEV